MTTKKKKAKRKQYPTKHRVVVFKAKHSDYKQMLALAKKLAKGNLSLLIRSKVLGLPVKSAAI